MVLTRGWEVEEMGRCWSKSTTSSYKMSIPADLGHRMVTVANNEYS